MNTELMTQEQKANFEAMEYQFKRDCKRQALEISTRLGATYNYNAGQLLTEAEAIYQWLIKTEA